VLFVATLPTKAETFEDNYIKYTTISSTEVKVAGTNYPPLVSQVNVSIPSTVEHNGRNYNVTEIGNGAFSVNGIITHVDIPNSVTLIGNSAFKLCSSITFVHIPSSVTSIGNYAFSQCLNLENVEIDNGDTSTSIGSEAFSGCYKLGTVTIGNGVVSIGDKAFRTCYSLESLTLPNSLISIGDEAFAGCSGLTSLALPNSVISIGSGVFQGCSGLFSIILPNSVTSIGSNAFAYCNGLSVVSIGENVTSIGDNAFHGCSVLRSIVIPNSVVSIGESAFDGCSDLHYITIGSGVTSIGKYAFSGCKNIESIIILCPQVGSWFNGMPIKNIRLGDDVISIDHSAFRGCSGMTSVSIGEKVTSIGAYAFYDCSGLTTIDLPNSLTTIGEYAFAGCSGLISLTIGESVKSIGKYAFASCKDVMISSRAPYPPQIEDDINANSIEVPVGSGCRYATAEHWNNIDTIYAVKDNVRLYPVPLFANGENVVSVSMESQTGVENEEGGKNEIMLLNNSVQNALIMQGGADITDMIKQEGKYVFLTSARHKDNIIESYVYPTHVIQLEESGTLINNIEIDDINNIRSLKVIGDINGTDVRTIRKMTNLKLLNLEDANIVKGGMAYYENNWNSWSTSDNTIGSYFFMGLDSLLSINLPQTILVLNGGPFSGCRKLRSVTIPNTIKTINQYLFSDCIGLTSVSIPTSVTSIGNDAFSGCSSLKKITIPESVTSIGEKAFSGCTSLYSITSMCTTPPQIKSNTFSQDTYNTAVLNVPVGCKANYWLHPYWEKFKNIKEVDVTSVKNILNDSANNNGTVYNLQGVRVSSNSGEMNQLSKGIYIFNGKKIIVK
jgi:hypothetical protein